MRTLGLVTLLSVASLAHGDLNFDEQLVPWGHDLLRVREVWPVARGANVNVVVMDTGIDYLHGDLAANYAGGIDIIYGTDAPLDTDSHGTGVAGVIAAADNTFGVVGVAPEARVWAAKFTRAPSEDEQVPPSVSDGYSVVTALEWVMEQKRERGGNWIVNCSFGDMNHVKVEEAAFRKAIDAGILIVAGGGNRIGGGSSEFYPAGYDGVIGVGAVDRRGNHASFSLQGSQVDVVAPGVGVPGAMTRDQGVMSSAAVGDDRFFGRLTIGRRLGDLVATAPLADCGHGHPGECGGAQAPFIAFVRRDDALTFNAQARNAMAEGAVAFVFANTEGAPEPRWTLRDPGDPETDTRRWPPAVGLTFEDGRDLLAHRGETVTVETTFGDYGVLFGTSFAAPYVAGVAALLWSAAPDATAAEIADAILKSARDAGPPGRDDAFGEGIVDARAAAERLVPHRFVPSGRRLLRRGN